MVDLGTPFSGINFGNQATAISSDGSVVVGAFGQSINPNPYHAFSWTQAGGLIDLGTLGGTNSAAFGVSAAGDVVVGLSGTTGDVATHAFRWTQLVRRHDRPWHAWWE
jgi:probable HAF family extracellular repeat protein